MEESMKVSRILIFVFVAIGIITIFGTQVSDAVLSEDSTGLNSGMGPDPVKVPVQLAPKNNTEYTHFPRKVILRWKSVSGASSYEVEVDCLGCRQAAKWDSEVGPAWQKTSVKVTSYSFEFSGDNQGRWRVRAVKAGRRSDWSPWWMFKFNTAGSSEPQADAVQAKSVAVQKATAQKIKAQTAKTRIQATQAKAKTVAAVQMQGVPKQFFLDFVDAYLVFVPGSNSIQISTEGTVLSYGNDWEKCRLRPYLYHIRQKNWKDFYWQVNTSRKEAYKVTGGQFCRIGGTAKKMDIVVDVVGGSDTTNPDRFFLKFKKAYLVFVPSSKTLQITAEGNVLSYGVDWMKCQMQPYLYHIKLNSWNDFYWKINTSRKEAHKVRGGEFCKLGGSESPLKMGVRVVD